jgi:hypothetical protein
MLKTPQILGCHVTSPNQGLSVAGRACEGKSLGTRLLMELKMLSELYYSITVKHSISLTTSFLQKSYPTICSIFCKEVNFRLLSNRLQRQGRILVEIVGEVKKNLGD